MTRKERIIYYAEKGNIDALRLYLRRFNLETRKLKVQVVHFNVSLMDAFCGYEQRIRPLRITDKLSDVTCKRCLLCIEADGGYE